MLFESVPNLVGLNLMLGPQMAAGMLVFADVF
jgi:hypothetical protein